MQKCGQTCQTAAIVWCGVQAVIFFSLLYSFLQLYIFFLACFFPSYCSLLCANSGPQLPPKFERIGNAKTLQQMGSINAFTAIIKRENINRNAQYATCFQMISTPSLASLCRNNFRWSRIEDSNNDHHVMWVLQNMLQN